MNEKENYKKSIINMIKELENEKLLEYFYHFIRLKIKAG